MSKKIIYKNDGTVPVEDILCTTYQMRNFYIQLRDGFFSDLDVMNYIQHLSAVRMMKKNNTVLDVCCGRGLLLPLMRYHAKTIKKYIGVDISEKNMESKRRNICNKKDIDPDEHYPFETEWIEEDVSIMSDKIKDSIDMIVYTSAIEHMHQEHGAKSLNQCSKVIRDKGLLFLSCPNTPEDQDGYDVRYKAHVYEWKLSELRSELKKNGFHVFQEIGLTGGIRAFKTEILPKLKGSEREFFEMAVDYIPNEFLKPVLFLNHPELASEVLLICKKGQKASKIKKLI